MKIEEVFYWYVKYIRDLRRTRMICQQFYNKRYQIGLRPQLCDIEAEITYLRIRELKPRTVIEFSPCTGWSTLWMLCALRDNKLGKLYSYDLIDDSLKIIPDNLKGRWEFIQGDVKETLRLNEFGSVDYVFIDSDHSVKFANWYIEQIFPYLGNVPVSIHDICDSYDPDTNHAFPESHVITKWIGDNKIDYFTASERTNKKIYDEIFRLKCELKINKRICNSHRNSMVFFEEPCGGIVIK